MEICIKNAAVQKVGSPLSNSLALALALTLLPKKAENNEGTYSYE